MITVHRQTDGRWTAEPVEDLAGFRAEGAWIDLDSPSEQERQAFTAATGLVLPTAHEMEEIEASSRSYEDQGQLVMTIPVMSAGDTPKPRISPVTFVLGRERIVTLRFTEPKPIGMYEERLRQGLIGPTAGELFFGLLDTFVDRLADILELVIARLARISDIVFAQHRSGELRRHRIARLRVAVREIGQDGRLLSMIRTSLSAFERALTYIAARQPAVAKSCKDQIKTLQRDIQSLQQQSAFHDDQVQLLLDATFGLINTEQADVVSLLSIIATIFLPPTLIASIYGMNFEFMPELSWPWGYPLAIVLILVSALGPLWIFRRKGWL